MSLRLEATGALTELEWHTVPAPLPPLARALTARTGQAVPRVTTAVCSVQSARFAGGAGAAGGAPGPSARRDPAADPDMSAEDVAREVRRQREAFYAGRSVRAVRRSGAAPGVPPVGGVVGGMERRPIFCQNS